MSRDDLYLGEIVEAIDTIDRWLNGADIDRWADDVLRSAVLHQLILIGEAALWQRSNQTVVYVTHNVSEAVYLSDRVAVFTPRPGRLRSVVDVELPRPRRRADMEFVQLVEHVTELVRRQDREDAQ